MCHRVILCPVHDSITVVVAVKASAVPSNMDNSTKENGKENINMPTVLEERISMGTI